MLVNNRDRFPGSQFLPDLDIKPYAIVDGETYLLVGYEDGDLEMPLVAREAPKLHATPLYELLKFTQGEITLLQQINNPDDAN